MIAAPIRHYKFSPFLIWMLKFLYFQRGQIGIVKLKNIHNRLAAKTVCDLTRHLAGLR